MKKQVLLFFTKLLSKIKQPLLPHVSVHRAVCVSNEDTYSEVLPLFDPISNAFHLYTTILIE